jgi:two-component system sensor histidine kinase PilS (NtrC family)
MAAGIAHEIRNPLASMAGSIQVLRSDLDLNPEQARLMDIVLRESQRLNGIIRDFLAYARPQRRPAQRVDLGRVVEEAAMLLRRDTAREPVPDVSVRVVPGCWALGDEAQLRQVLWNLTSNALNAMPDGGRLELVVEPAADGHVVLTVRDEGVGIAAADLDRVFEPFRSSSPGGTGLGLPIVHRIVTDAGGSIELESSAGVGTTVRVLLPRAPAPAVHALSA